MDIFEYLRIDKPLDQLPASYFPILSQMVEDCFGGTKAELGQFSDFLQETVVSQLRAVSPEVRAAILQHQPVSPELRQAYAMGQLAFAQALVSSMCSGRVDDSFEPTLLQRKYRDVLKLLLAKDMSDAELARLTNSTTETISRKMYHLRRIGAADFRKDFRKDGANVINFLTLPAKSVLEHHRIRPKAVGDGVLFFRRVVIADRNA
ncbi:hypothetical protein V0M98_33355 (plasmid) [Pseudomonas silesiensis]|uniref:hypothetical protein n=1 Tax=Pseudomonas silesiensis TaxID=1853130 RepID=UPI0030CE851C